jgi:hypothetical protein
MIRTMSERQVRTSNLIRVDRLSLHYTTLCTEHSIVFHGFHVSLKKVNPNRPGDFHTEQGWLSLVRVAYRHKRRVALYLPLRG